MSASAAAGALLGAVFGVGLVLVGWHLASLRRPRLEQRLAPYLRDAPPSRLLAPADAESRWGPALTRMRRRAATGLGAVLGGDTALSRRLVRAGRAPDVAAFRTEQLMYGLAGAGLGVVAGAFAWRAQPQSPILATLLPPLAGAIGVLARDYLLTREVRRRQDRMLAQFPTVAELLALSVSAGEGAGAALERVCRLATGDLAGELRQALHETRAGASLPTALRGVADRVALPSLERFVQGVIIAMERGTPLGEVLRAQAADAREQGRRQVLEAAGRREISMMVPVVFLILPVTVIFAVYPGLIALRLGP